MLPTWENWYLGACSADDPLSPLYANLAGLPPLLIQVGGAEMLLDDVVELTRRAESAGVRVECRVFENMVHH